MIVLIILLLCMKNMHSYETYNRNELNNMKIDHKNKIRNIHIYNVVESITNKVIDSAEKGEDRCEYNIFRSYYNLYCKNKLCNIEYIQVIVNEIVNDVYDKLNLIFYDSDITYNVETMSFIIYWN